MHIMTHGHNELRVVVVGDAGGTKGTRQREAESEKLGQL